MITKKPKTNKKANLHPRNKHIERYDFDVLTTALPALKEFVRPNQYGDLSIDFSNPTGVKALNSALLKHYYNINFWDIPEGHLCSPIPGRADYIHYIADLLAEHHNNEIPKGEKTICLDIGVGANCVYPIIGNSEYGWSFIGSDISEVALASAKNIVSKNPQLKDKVDLRLQGNPNSIFRDILADDEHITVSICNPPFHASAEAALSSNFRKLKNLTGKEIENPELNFGGQHNELWCDGGELKFIKNIIFQSRNYKNNCTWFSSLVSKKENIRPLKKALKEAEAASFKVIPMGQGNKVSRIIAWTFND
ncbi:23S rRNA (adenine(1618)-N(6))-methyltransferase RlmF [Aquimarina agarivorans]|uniref:23S rRNA (adenine(1618)-N(6))-methyltransferase RlmF n=1 Tax=Aquimarina agarivorans TaxID=980584 RepID=UPI000248EB55|nr:23S rRNA (adenine(1618)-N(6))-methyltransferase RlmF [Aquimarina agarivorans]